MEPTITGYKSSAKERGEKLGCMGGRKEVVSDVIGKKVNIGYADFCIPLLKNDLEMLNHKY